MELKGKTTFLKENQYFEDGVDAVLQVEIPAEVLERLRGFPVGFHAEVGVSRGTRVRVLHNEFLDEEDGALLNFWAEGSVLESFWNDSLADYGQEPHLLVHVCFDGEGSGWWMDIRALEVVNGN